MYITLMTNCRKYAFVLFCKIILGNEMKVKSVEKTKRFRIKGFAFQAHLPHFSSLTHLQNYIVLCKTHVSLPPSNSSAFSLSMTPPITLKWDGFPQNPSLKTPAFHLSHSHVFLYWTIQIHLRAPNLLLVPLKIKNIIK